MGDRLFQRVGDLVVESFGFVGKGEGFWFINSVGLLELAVNRGNAAATYGLKVGDPVPVRRLN